MKDRRGDVVRKTAVEADAAAGSDGSEVGFENVAGEDREIREFLRQVAKARGERGVDFDGVNGSASGEEVLGYLTMTRTDFDPAMLIVARERNGSMTRNAEGASDLFLLARAVGFRGMQAPDAFRQAWWPQDLM